MKGGYSSQLVHRPRLVPVAQLVQLRVCFGQGCKSGDDGVVDVVAPHEQVLPVLHALPFIRDTQPPCVRDVPHFLIRVLLFGSSTLCKVSIHTRVLSQFNQLLERLQQVRLGFACNLRQLPPTQQRSNCGLAGASVAAQGVTLLKRHVALDHEHLGRLLQLHHLAGQGLLEPNPVLQPPQAIQAELLVVRLARILLQNVPLAKALCAAHPLLNPHRLLTARYLVGLYCARGIPQKLLSQLKVPCLDERQRRLGDLAVAATPPQPTQHVILIQQFIQLKQRIKAAQVVGEHDHVAF
mmetsp:Transcript_16006/g.43628  ORF Transcript_16006/g.43628 Transcript_16006/m.43628 type:complete len:295 (+) Transcript_16006:2942-3826(+)